MATKHVVIWPKARLTIDGKSKILNRGDTVPAGVTPVDLANLVSFGAIAGTTDRPGSAPGTAAVPLPTSATVFDPAVDGKTIESALAYVGDDTDRAQVVLDAENAADTPRSTLVEALTKLTKS